MIEAGAAGLFQSACRYPVTGLKIVSEFPSERTLAKELVVQSAVNTNSGCSRCHHCRLAEENNIQTGFVAGKLELHKLEVHLEAGFVDDIAEGMGSASCWDRCTVAKCRLQND